MSKERKLLMIFRELEIFSSENLKLVTVANNIEGA